MTAIDEILANLNISNMTLKSHPLWESLTDAIRNHEQEEGHARLCLIQTGVWICILVCIPQC